MTFEGEVRLEGPTPTRLALFRAQGGRSLVADGTFNRSQIKDLSRGERVDITPSPGGKGVLISRASPDNNRSLGR